MNKKIKISKHFLLVLCVTLPIFAVMLTLDLVSKHLLDSSLAPGSEASFIPGFINFVIIHNEGAAWGAFSGAKIFLIILAFVFVLGLGWLLIAERTKNPLFHIAVGLVLTGCVGNLVDRLVFGYVRDFLHFEFWKDFPVFNVADICLTIGVVLFAIYIVMMLVKSHRKKGQEKGEEKN